MALTTPKDLRIAPCIAEISGVYKLPLGLKNPVYSKRAVADTSGSLDVTEEAGNKRGARGERHICWCADPPGSSQLGGFRLGVLRAAF